MTVSAMNHFTILTADVDATLAFYGEFLGLRAGPRPPFTFPGLGCTRRAAATRFCM